MLTLTRRIGETIYVGDDTCITVYDRLRYHVLLGVLAPVHADVRFGESSLRPAILPSGERFYLLTMLSQDAFEIDDVRVSIAFRPTFLNAASVRTRQLKISIEAPASVPIFREEIYMERLKEQGACRPLVPFSTWLHRANLAISGRMVA